MNLRTLLLVEDNPADIKIAQRALREADHGVELIVARDGREALDYLLREGVHSHTTNWQPPALVLLDVNLPGLTGRQVLEQIRATPRLRMLPVVVLTTSRRVEDIQEMYGAGANSYIEKPQEYRRFVEIMETLQSYWFDVAQLPTLPS
jgi:CheY-like chemotaxis protein